MSFIGAMGVVAQQGNQVVASAPTGVSIATSSSGNYDESFTVADSSGCNFGAMDVSAVQWSSNALTHTAQVDQFVNFDGCDSASQNKVYGYIRATGATSFQWNLDLTSQSLSNGCIAAIGNSGSGSTSQDCTSSGVTETIVIVFGGGRGGQTYPAHGDSLVVTLEATATNSSGSTSATDCVLTYSFSA